MRGRPFWGSGDHDRTELREFFKIILIFMFLVRTLVQTRFSKARIFFILSYPFEMNFDIKNLPDNSLPDCLGNFIF
jgi:hypothetical protein